MGAQSVEGTGPGSATRSLPPIYNGVVKNENVEVNALTDYRIDINASGNIEADGYVRGKESGQLLNISVNTFSGTYTNNTGTFTNIVSLNYTPVSNSSVLVINFDTAFDCAGSQNDVFESQIVVDGSVIAGRIQTFSTTTGATVRGNVLFPISYSFGNSSTTAKTIAIQGRRSSGDDTLTVDKTQSILTIHEIAQ